MPRQVIHHVTAALQHRDRDAIGARLRQDAKRVLQLLLGVSVCSSNSNIFLGPNATSCLASLAHAMAATNFCRNNDDDNDGVCEIVISTENHVANVKPWLDLAAATQSEKCKVVWWNPFDNTNSTSQQQHRLEDLLNERTRIVAIPQASNILGQLRDGHVRLRTPKIATGPHCRGRRGGGSPRVRGFERPPPQS